MIRQPAGQPRAAGAPGKAARPRPALHFAPRQGWMNDPNGLIQWNGRVHLFYQHNPSGPVWGNMTWGHASTTDLWTWEDHSLALEPDPAGPERDGCFSGCAITRNGRPYLLYTGVNGPHQLPCLAEAASQDLTSWTPDDGNPVIACPPPDQAVRAFRDHSAWWADSMWYQVVGGGLEDRGGALFLYRSADLRSWQYMGIFAAAADHGLEGTIWECPDVFALDDTVIVVVSVHDGGPLYSMWMTGQVAGHEFTPQTVGRCDSGHRYYAPQSLTLTDGRRVAIGWLQENLSPRRPLSSATGVLSTPALRWKSPLVSERPRAQPASRSGRVAALRPPANPGTGRRRSSTRRGGGPGGRRLIDTQAAAAAGLAAATAAGARAPGCTAGVAIGRLGRGRSARLAYPGEVPGRSIRRSCRMVRRDLFGIPQRARSSLLAGISRPRRRRDMP